MSSKEEQQYIHSRYCKCNGNYELCCENPDNYPDGRPRVNTEEIVRTVEEIKKNTDNILKQMSIHDRWLSGN